MKKLMITLAAGLMAAAVMADVQSQNIVGYRTLDITRGKLNMICVTWDKVGGGALDISAVLEAPLANGLQGGSTWLGNSTQADQLRVWNPVTSGYKYYYLYDSGGEYPDWDGKWVDNDTGELAGDPFAKGSTAWLLSQGSGPNVGLTQMGEAPAAASVAFSITAGKLNMLGSPYPMGYELNGAGAPALLALGAQGGSTWLGNSTQADQIRVWNPVTSGYKFYYLYNSGGEYPGWDGKWIDNDTGEITADTLPLGTAFWYLSQGNTAFNFTFSKPY